MSNLSLEKSIRTCKVETGWADRMQSDRFLNPNQMVCVPWNGYNNKGQSVCPDSWYTKTPGCNSAEDRVVVENAQRPQYSDYVNLNVSGLQGHIYGNVDAHDETVATQRDMAKNNLITGDFGLQWLANTRTTGACAVNSYEKAMAQMSQSQRQQQFLNQGFEGYKNAQRAGF